MKIREIIESLDKIANSVEASIFKPSTISVNSDINQVLSDLRNNVIGKNQAIFSLEQVATLIEQLIYSSTYFDELENTIPKHFSQLVNDWIELDNKLKTLLQHLRN
jgi:hypothetical protein